MLSLYWHSALQLALRIELQCIFLETLLAGRVISFRGDHVPTALICKSSMHQTVLLAAWIFAQRRRALALHPAGGERRKTLVTLLECRPCASTTSTSLGPHSARTPGKWRDTGVKNAAWCIGHGPPAQVGGCGLSQAAGPAWHVVFCGPLSPSLDFGVLSSPLEGRTFRALAFSPRILPPLRSSNLIVEHPAVLLLEPSGCPLTQEIPYSKVQSPLSDG